MSKPSRRSTNPRPDSRPGARSRSGGAPGGDDKLRNSLRPGHKLHWYQIERILGQGGFGITYLAHDGNLDQHVAIKEYLPMELAVREGDFSVYPASRAQDARYQWGLERFLAEARTLARFRHPAIVRVLSVFEANNTAYMVMEYQHGEALQHLLDARGTLPERELVSLVVPLLDGLETIHAQGFIHRDIKPSNIFIRSDGHPVLLDFGSARQALGQETQTLTSVVSPGYAPFEQYYSRSDRQGPWTDIYGLGATLYRCVTGLQPMAAIDRSEAILKAERDVFVTASEIGAGNYSRSFLAAIDCALEFNEKKRPQTIAEWRPRFEFSTTVETELFDPAGTTWPEDGPTRFSHVVDDTIDLGTAAVVNDATRDDGSARGSRRADTRPRSAPPSQPPAAASAAPASAPAPALDAPPRRRWPALVAVLLVLGAGLGYAAWSGLLPIDPFGGAKAARLVAQGDRALAAGQALEPPRSSALAYYRRAWDARPGHEDAVHGLRLTGERLIAALDAAVDAGDTARVAALQPLLDTLPPGVVETDAVRARLAAAGARNAEAARQQERIEAFLAAAEDDIASGRLTGAGTDNALARYRAVQILDPDNTAATTGLRRLATALAERGRAAVEAGDLEAAREHLARARALGADDGELGTLADELRATVDQANDAMARAEQVAALLEAAQADLEADRLTTPEGNNALERYRAVQALEPDSAEAARGVQQVHDRYVAMATQALARQEFDGAAQYTRRALAVIGDSAPAHTLQREIAAGRARLDREEAERLAREAEAQAAAQAAERAAAERARVAAEAERRRRQEEEARRLLAEAERKAEAEKQARAAAQRAAEEAVNARPRMVLDFHGFHPRYAREGMTRDLLYQQVAPLVAGAGYEIVTRGDVHDANYKWTNVKLMAYRLSVNENTATGLYSYAGSLLVLPRDTLILPLTAAMDRSPVWNRGHNGLGPPTDLRKLFDQFVDMTRAYLSHRPGIRR